MIQLPPAIKTKHVAYLDRLLLENFREIRRLRLGKQSGARRKIEELQDEVRLIDETLRLIR